MAIDPNLYSEVERMMRRMMRDTKEARATVRKGETRRFSPDILVPPGDDTGGGRDDGGGDGGGGGDDQLAGWLCQAVIGPAYTTPTSPSLHVMPLALVGLGDESAMHGDAIWVPDHAVYEVRLRVRFTGPLSGGVTDTTSFQVSIGPSGAGYVAGQLQVGPSSTTHHFFDSVYIELGDIGEPNVYATMSSSGNRSYNIISAGLSSVLEVRRLSIIGAGIPAELPPVEFTLTAPGNLTIEGSDIYADYKVSDTNFGYSKAQTEAMLASILPNGGGWERAGIIFRQSEDAAVTYQVVEEATCNAPELACTHSYTDGTVLVELEYNHLQQRIYPNIFPENIINHETGHAFFGATHTGNGIMSDFDNDRPPWPTDNDITSVIDWLGT